MRGWWAVPPRIVRPHHFVTIKAVLQIAYLPNFKSQHTLLFAGSREDIEFFRAFFVEWSGDELDLIEYLQKRGVVRLGSVSKICLRRAPKQDSFAWKNNDGVWLISEPFQDQITGLLDGLVRAQANGHQYLEPAGAHVQIMVSIDEGYQL
jgi:hypothetical protein